MQSRNSFPSLWMGCSSPAPALGAVLQRVQCFDPVQPIVLPSPFDHEWSWMKRAHLHERESAGHGCIERRLVGQSSARGGCVYRFHRYPLGCEHRARVRCPGDFEERREEKTDLPVWCSMELDYASRTVGDGEAVDSEAPSAQSGRRHSEHMRRSAVRGHSLRVGQWLCLAFASAVLRSIQVDGPPPFSDVDQGQPVATATCSASGEV